MCSHFQLLTNLQMRFISSILTLLLIQEGLSAIYPVTDASQSNCYDTVGSNISCASTGQDGAYSLLTQLFCDHEDDTVTDMRTALMWTKQVYGPMSISAALSSTATFSLAGYSDWRIPTMKELYSTIDFDGVTGTSEATNIPYQNPVFEVEYGTTRYIDGQIWSSTTYVAKVVNGQSCNFGLNPIDGRIKCYGGNLHVRYVRGITTVGQNDFAASSEVVADRNTGLEWQRYDSGFYNAGGPGDGNMDWPTALSYCEILELEGHDDWRLPNAHELQSIVDYTRSPDTTNSPAIDSIFGSKEILNEANQADFGWYWTSDTHLDGQPMGKNAVYIAFGRATGNFTIGGGTATVMDVHGAGAQRSSPKVGPNPFPEGHGPQGDFLRAENLVRCVRGTSSASEFAPVECVSGIRVDDFNPPIIQDDGPNQNPTVPPNQQNQNGPLNQQNPGAGPLPGIGSGGPN
jgi:hypothetical protein